jgi:hypothetical protein
MKLRILPTPTDLDGPRRIIALKTFESETGRKDDEKVGKTRTRIVHQQLHKVRLNAYPQPQAG